MTSTPRISVVTPSLNQAKFIRDTVESVSRQGYANLEHIVVDGMSSDETPSILACYPHLRVIREPDLGQADAINKGFNLATGDVLCFLNSDDTLLPGALARVALEIDAAKGRHVVVGRSIYVTETGAPVGQEHCWTAVPTHRRILQAWKGNCIPQPSTFWTAEAWRYCGPLDDSEHLVFDYDFVCRLSSRYRLHPIDEVLATYRLHADSKSCSSRQHDVLARSIGVSRKYWGPALGWPHWQLNLSRAVATGFAGARRTAKRYLRRFRILDRRSPLTLMWRDFQGIHEDGGVGPVFVTKIRLQKGHRRLVLQCGPVFQGAATSSDVALRIDGRPVPAECESRDKQLLISTSLGGIKAGEHELEVRSRQVIIPHEYLANGDFRPLAFRLNGVTLAGEEMETQSLHPPKSAGG
jgi:glycosyltransferase involved in cell wall biosynthesis